MLQVESKPTPSSPIEHLADRIIALINSKPRSPTKCEIIAALQGTEPTDHNDETLDYGMPFSALDVQLCEDRYRDNGFWLGQAMATLKWDSEAHREKTREILSTDEGRATFMKMVDTWKEVREELEAYRECLKAAHTRAMVTACWLTETKPDLKGLLAQS